MNQKLILSLSFALFSSFVSFGQFYHAGGAGLVAGKGKIPAGAESGSEQPSILGYGVFYHPRFNISETGSGAISVGFPITAGLSGTVSSQEGSSLSIIADLPITVDYNFGHGSNGESESGFGGFLGAGFSYTYSNYRDEFYIPGVIDEIEQVKGSSYGPLAHAGIRALIGERTYFLRGFYKMGLENAKFKTIGIAAGLQF
jgi:hypothetical protein